MTCLEHVHLTWANLRLTWLETWPLLTWLGTQTNTWYQSTLFNVCAFIVLFMFCCFFLSLLLMLCFVLFCFLFLLFFVFVFDGFVFCLFFKNFNYFWLWKCQSFLCLLYPPQVATCFYVHQSLLKYQMLTKHSWL